MTTAPDVMNLITGGREKLVRTPGKESGEGRVDVSWRLHLKSAPAVVYKAISSDEGRARFWAESAVEADGRLHFIFPNGQRWQGKVLEVEPPWRFSLEYIDNTVVILELQGDGRGGTNLQVINRGIVRDSANEVMAGWVSVLLALKAAVDFGVDLRNHDSLRTWDQGFVDN